MNVESFVNELTAAATLTGERAVLRITATCEPAGGPGSKVYPPTYPTRDGGSPYVIEPRVVDGDTRDNVLLDSTPSQANRCEEALERACRSGAVAIPLMELRHNGAIEVVLTSLRFPHRYADAYLRDSLIEGVKFDKSALGKQMLAATLDDARALYRQDPGSLVFGAWNSHRQGRQQKFPRIYASEIVGWDPVAGRRNAGRMDPLNLTGAAKHVAEDWEFAPVLDKGAKKVAGEKLSEIGHGNIAPNPAHGGVTITSATRMATISLAALDRIGFGDASPEAAHAGRALLAAYALLADRLAFGGPSLWLRSGCELVLVREQVEWVDRGGGTEQLALSRSQAIEVFDLAAEHAAKHGLALATDPVALVPSPALAKAIEFAMTKAETTGD